MTHKLRVRLRVIQWDWVLNQGGEPKLQGCCKDICPMDIKVNSACLIHVPFQTIAQNSDGEVFSITNDQYYLRKNFNIQAM